MIITVRITLMLILTCLFGQAAETSPGEAAIAYLEEIRENRINLDPGETTAISPYILEDKLTTIATRLKRLGSSLGQSVSSRAMEPLPDMLGATT